MKIIITLFIMILLSTSALAGSVPAVEAPKKCKQCGMDRTEFAYSRMLVVYTAGTIAGLCSLRCAAAELQQNKAEQVSALMVADYYSKKLLDARKAVWVVGGKVKGVMTALAKWAFAEAADARIFVEENGGIVDSFDHAMNSATKEVLDQAAEERAVNEEMLRNMQ